MRMKRHFFEILQKWEESRTKEPMLVIGARQTGKTYIIREFCKETYSDYMYLNLETDPALITAFEGNLSPEAILRELEILTGRQISESMAIFIDEIQQSEQAITALKYFCESPKNYRVIGAGSLLGVKLHRFKGSFPVGKVRLKCLYPLSFSEFLLACGEDLLTGVLEEHTKTFQPIKDSIHDRLLRLYHDYLYVGGMPQSVLNYLEAEKNITHIDRELLLTLTDSYLADMTKYTTSAAEGVKIQETYRSIPRQLARDNPKFKYKEIRTHAVKRDFLLPVDWLISSKMVWKVIKVEFTQSPLKAYGNEDHYKLYFSDPGILARLSGIRYGNLMSSDYNLFKGAVAENFVITQMAQHLEGLYYYHPDQSMEIDLLMDTQDGIIPVEIKAGRHRRSTSLKNYCKKNNPPYAYRLSENNFGESAVLRYVPIYAAEWICG